MASTAQPSSYDEPFTCKRCGGCFKSKQGLGSHLRKAKPCPAVLSHETTADGRDQEDGGDRERMLDELFPRNAQAKRRVELKTSETHVDGKTTNVVNTTTVTSTVTTNKIVFNMSLHPSLTGGFPVVPTGADVFSLMHQLFPGVRFDREALMRMNIEVNLMQFEPAVVEMFERKAEEIDRKEREEKEKQKQARRDRGRDRDGDGDDDEEE